MQAKDPRSPAHPEPPRQHLTSPWTLLGIALAVGVTLVLIFPGRGLLTTSLKQQLPDAVSLTYLSNMARKQPDNPELTFTLAQKRVEVGQIAEARAALESLYNSPDPAVRQRARFADFKLQMQQLHALPAQSAQRERQTEQLRQELSAMAQYEWDARGLLELAELARQLGARKLHAQLYYRVMRADTAVSREWIDDIAKKVLADGEYLTAAEMYFTAQSRATALEDQRHYFMQALRAYQAGNMVREALLAADVHMGPLAKDDETLRFVIRFARMANDMERAQSYVKRLMHMSAADAFRRWLKSLLASTVPSALAAERDRPTRGPPPGMRPYDPENYQLAYEIFLASKNLQDAYRVARAAVDQVPHDMRWRQRLAQVAEWRGRSGEALEQWLYIARNTGSAAAWEGVLRLAPGVGDDEVLLEALRYRARTSPFLSDPEWRAIVAAYERLGRQREGIEFLEQEYARRPRPGMLDTIAYLRERTGDVDGAIAAYRRLIERDEPTIERVMTLVTLLIQRGDYRAAYDVLEQHRGRAPPEDVEYLRLLADLALRLRENQAAQAAYEHLVEHPRANLDDFVRLVNLLHPRQPEAAARLAEIAYNRYGSREMLLTALSVHSQRRDFIALKRLFSSISPENERELVRNPGFLLLRADYYAATRNDQLALADYREALRIDPQNRQARLGLMYFLIDRRQLDALRREIALATELARDDVDFQGVLGAAWLALGEPQRALPYFAAVVKRNPDDYLWLLNYADALERTLQPEIAWRVRRHAWIKIRQELRKFDRPPLDVLRAQARLAAQFMPGDQGLAAIRNLLREDAPADTISANGDRRGIEAATRELVLAWTISTEQYLAAKAWLWNQYARNLAQPAWAEVNVALAHNDVETLQRALEAYPDQIPAYDRHEAARRTQQYRLAQDIAFTELERLPQDDEMHLRLTQSVLEMTSHTEVGYTNVRRGTISGNEWNAEVAIWVSPRLRLSFDVTHVDQHLLNRSALATVPGTDRTYGMTALWRHSVGETRSSVFHRSALADVTGFRLLHQHPLGPRLNSRVGVAYNERTVETSALAAGGVRDQVFLDLQYTPSKREYVLGHLFANRYYTQDERTRIGSAYGLHWEAGHRFRTEYPDWHVRAAGSVNHFSQSGSGDAATAALNPEGTIPGASFFLPGSFSVFGLYTGFGTFYRTNYTRAIRPFVDVGVLHNTVTGNGYSALAGFSGSVVGGDRLTLYISSGRGGTGVNESTREIGVRYMYLFDHF